MDLSTLSNEELDQLITQKQQPTQDLSSISDEELDRMIAEKSNQEQPKDIRSSKMIPQLTKGLYESLPFGKKIVSMLPNAEQIQQQMATTPRPQGFLPSFARGAGGIAPDLAMSSPFMRGAGLVSKIPAIAKSALGFGAYGGTKAAIQGEPIIPAALQSAGSAALFHGAGKLGATALQKLPMGERLGSALGGGFIGGLTGGEEGMALGTGLGALYPASKLQPSEQTTKFAKSIVNYALKPDKSSKRFGADPVEGIVKEGILGKNWQETGEKAQVRINKLQDHKNRIKLDARNNEARIDYTENKVFEPILELRNELLKDPKVHQAIIKEIDTNVKSLGTGVNLKSLDIDTAFDLQARVKRMEPTQMDRVSTKEVAKKLRQVYHKMGEAIKNNPQVSPELRTTLERIHNLSAAKEAITDAQNRNSGVWNIIPMGMFGYGIMAHNPLIAGLVAGRAVLKTPMVSTGISKMISEKYPKIP